MVGAIYRLQDLIQDEKVRTSCSWTFELWRASDFLYQDCSVMEGRCDGGKYTSTKRQGAFYVHTARFRQSFLPSARHGIHGERGILSSIDHAIKAIRSDRKVLLLLPASRTQLMEMFLADNQRPISVFLKDPEYPSRSIGKSDIGVDAACSCSRM